MSHASRWRQLKVQHRQLRTGPCSPLTASLPPPLFAPQVDFGDQLLVVGDVEQLGAWELERAAHMVWTEGDVWQASVDLPSGTAAEFKFVLSSPKR